MRRRRAEKRQVTPDTKFNDLLVARLVAVIMRRGARTTAERIVYGAFEQVRKTTSEEPLKVFSQALDNAKPRVEVKSRRVGGATYQVPVEVDAARGASLALRWLVASADGRKGVPMERALALEIVDAFKNQGNAVKKRDDVHKMAQANKAFAHYRW